jgi:hypothetical protein
MKRRKIEKKIRFKRPRECNRDYNYFQKRTKYYHDFYPNEVEYNKIYSEEEYTAYSLDFY